MSSTLPTFWGFHISISFSFFVRRLGRHAVRVRATSSAFNCNQSPQSINPCPRLKFASTWTPCLKVVGIRCVNRQPEKHHSRPDGPSILWRCSSGWGPALCLGKILASRNGKGPIEWPGYLLTATKNVSAISIQMPCEDRLCQDAREESIDGVKHNNTTT